MRLQLIVVATLAAAAPRSVGAQEREPGEGEVSSKLSVYSDDDETTVTTTVVDGEVALPSETAVGAHVLIDSVSTASVDVISAATGRWTENRVETGARAIATLANIQTALRYVLSQENDWLSHAVQLGAGRDFAQQNTRVEGAYVLTLNDVGRVNDPTFARDLVVHSVQTGVTQLWSKTTLLQGSYSLQIADGYQSSPYRYVRFDDGMSSVLETHPDSRLRHAFNVRGLRTLGTRMAIDTGYRFYFDDWGVTSHTLFSALRLELGDAMDLRFRARGYYQTGADFYQDGYTELQRYMTADRELSDFWNVSGGVKLDYHLGAFVFDAKVDAIRYEFSNFSRLPRRTALISELGARFAW